MSIRIEVLREASDEAVAALAALLPQLSSSAPPLSAELLRTVIEAASNTLLVARDDSQGGAIVGALTLVCFPIPTGWRAWIEDVVVDGSQRGRGVGEALTREALVRARAAGARTVDLTSRRSREAAHRLYEKVGFAVRETSVYRVGLEPQKRGA